ncbi:hyaluronoglucosaminidase [Kitasatospora phosalacinea]|uniref:hyaluronoglucosaminidase n=1 Tax=Kitasatospora phosalacinea TaxID=2065 RepID=UPI00365FB305
MNRRLFMGAFTAGAVTVAVGNADSAGAADQVTVFNGQVSAQSFYADGLGGQAACFTTTSKAVDYAHALVAVQNGTTGFEADGVTPKLNGGSAINAVSRNPDTSAMYLTGVEKARGTLKITHMGYDDATDKNAAALSIDLRTAGTAAQGIYVTATDGATQGNLIALRNNTGLDDFVVKGSGLVGIGTVRGDNPRAKVHVVQRTGTDAAGLLVEGTVRVGNVATAPTGVDAAAGGGTLFAQGGALYWRGSAGTVTKIASA